MQEVIPESFPGYFGIIPVVTFLPDTIFIKSDPAAPGGELTLTFSVHLHSNALGGVISFVHGLPLGLDTTAGSWYEWTPGFLQLIQ